MLESDNKPGVVGIHVANVPVSLWQPANADNSRPAGSPHDFEIQPPGQLNHGLSLFNSGLEKAARRRGSRSVRPENGLPVSRLPAR
jgi:hypothetical protein